MTVACKRRMVGGGLSGYPGDDVALIFKSPSHGGCGTRGGGCEQNDYSHNRE